MRMAAKAANPFAARWKSLCQHNFNALVSECAALAEPGYQDRPKLTLIVGKKMGAERGSPDYLLAGLANSRLTTPILDRHPGVGLLQDRDDLRLGKPRLLH
jgi:hypothetical protein